MPVGGAGGGVYRKRDAAVVASRLGQRRKRTRIDLTGTTGIATPLHSSQGRGNRAHTARKHRAAVTTNRRRSRTYYLQPHRWPVEEATLDQNWTGTAGTITITGESGTFQPGPVTWVGSDGTITISGTPGTFTPGAVTWTGTAGTIFIEATSGTFTLGPAPQTWTGTAGTITITGEPGSFVPGAVTWTGTNGTITITGTSGTFTVAAPPEAGTVYSTVGPNSTRATITGLTEGTVVVQYTSDTLVGASSGRTASNSTGGAVT